MCIIGQTHEAPQQVLRLLFYSLSYFIGAAGLLLSKVLAARKKNLSNAPARKNRHCSHARRCSQRPFYTPHSIWNLLVICPVLPGELKEDILEALKRTECKTIWADKCRVVLLKRCEMQRNRLSLFRGMPVACHGKKRVDL